MMIINVFCQRAALLVTASWISRTDSGLGKWNKVGGHRSDLTLGIGMLGSPPADILEPQMEKLQAARNFITYK